MSLKGFHLVFIACSAALAVVFGVWLLGGATPSPGRTVAAVAAFAVAAALVVYESWFLRYLRRRS